MMASVKCKEEQGSFQRVRISGDKRRVHTSLKKALETLSRLPVHERQEYIVVETAIKLQVCNSWNPKATSVGDRA